MSYCVNCGVELDRCLKKCPLCGVEVINPRHEETEENKESFPQTRDELKKADRVFWINFISILSAVPIAICVLCNLLYNNSLDWSVYVISGIVMLWSVCVSPLLYKKFSYLKMITTDMAGILAGLLIMELFTPVKGWLLLIALPLVAYCYLSWLLVVRLTKKKVLKGLNIAAAYIFALNVMLVLLEMLLDLYSSGSISIVWSWFIIAPCLSVAALLVLLDRNDHVKQEISRRLHI